MLFGRQESNCPKPCKLTSVIIITFLLNFLTKTLIQVVSRNIENFIDDFPGFGFNINHKIEVTESYVPDFSFTAFLAGLGGSLGLWLGVGAVQILSLAFSILIEFDCSEINCI